MEDQWFTVPEAADYLGVSERWMRRQIDARKISFNKLGAVIRFRQSVLDELLDQGEFPAPAELPTEGQER